MNYFHSVTLDERKCHGCTNCIARCPTEAIRVRRGKARIIKDRCIDCGECVKVCQSHAKQVATDSFDILKEYKYNVALPAPSFYSQFRGDTSVNKILTAFLKIGFDDVFEVARGAEYISGATRKLIEAGNLKKPVISSACPAVLRLIQARFPELLENVLSLVSPMEAAGRLALEEAVKKTGLPENEIGIVFITPCPAKVTSIKAPITVEKSSITGVIAAKDAYAKIRPIIETIEDECELQKASHEGIFWARSGGESSASGVEDYLAVDGINNVIQVLEEIEYGKVTTVEFVELSACTSGCSGGALNIVNPFLASRRVVQQSKKQECASLKPPRNLDVESLRWEKPVESAPELPLDSDFDKAMKKMEIMDEVYARLPKIDCGSCGAPSCKALAEDIARGHANENYCIFIMREKVQKLSEQLFKLSEWGEDLKDDKEDNKK